ncbi:MAG: mismatch repair protein MutL [Planctomycetota bacterium]|nr:mismatch repair protein MutL [Planctomycetota bacterium]
MGIIRQLPSSVINQIAAGEVVERPASVVKELLENAIDAGASRVEVSVERGGKDLIRVADNGTGMDREDLVLAFQPHATSKLAEAEDLFRIRTLGFRGEALAAIAEVSRVRCQSRTSDAPHGVELSIDAGIAVPIRECAWSQGTMIEVRNLFFNTPVRRTFLKSDSTESGHVAEMFTRIALAHPTVHLTFKSGGKTVYDLQASTGIKERVATFFGKELAESLLWIENRTESIHIWGYVAHPSQSRSTPKGQFLFVGGRYVRDRSLGHALSESYRGLLMVGRLPVAFLFLDIPPEDVDVNVHPTKVEVRFRDGHRIYSQLLASVRQTFLTSDLHSRLQAPPPVGQELTPDRTDSASPASFGLSAAASDKQSVSSWFSSSPTKTFQNFPPAGYAGGRPEPSWAANLPPAPSGPQAPRVFNEFREPDAPAETTSTGKPAASITNVDSEPFTASGLPTHELPPKAIQVHDTYLIAETADGMVVIDQHALHERILYEELKARVMSGGVESQRLLVPETVDLSAADGVELLQRKDVLAQLGLGIEPFGGDTVLVTSVPAMLHHVPADRLVKDLADHFRSSPIAPTADGLLEDVLNMVACKAAVKANQKLSADEIEALLARRHLAANTHHCPHGRPTALTFTKAELERQFGRI